MRWDDLFDDLESQLEHELTAEEIDLRAEEERLRLGRISLRDRILAIHDAAGFGTAAPDAASRDAAVRAGAGHGRATGGTIRGDDVASVIRVQLAGGPTISVRPLSFGKDWFSAELVEESLRHSQCIVPLAAVTALLLDRAQVQSSLTASETAGHTLAARLGLAFVLRDLCRRRASVELQLVDGVAHGTIDRVGRDHLDLAVHEPGTPRREAEVSHYRVVPFGALQLVRL